MCCWTARNTRMNCWIRTCSTYIHQTTSLYTTRFKSTYDTIGKNRNVPLCTRIVCNLTDSKPWYVRWAPQQSSRRVQYQYFIINFFQTTWLSTLPTWQPVRKHTKSRNTQWQQFYSLTSLYQTLGYSLGIIPTNFFIINWLYNLPQTHSLPDVTAL